MLKIKGLTVVAALLITCRRKMSKAGGGKH